MNRCAFATQIRDLVPDAPRGGPVRGLCVHTSGRGVVDRAAKERVPAIEVALAFYQRAEFSAHYVVDYDGALYQITADDRRVQHVGLEAEDRLAYLDGTWLRRVSPAAAKLWRARWPFHRSPAHLYPSRAPNTDFVAVELLPLAKAEKGGLWYTAAQHDAVGELAADLARRHRWPSYWLDGWSGRAWASALLPSLVAHEDLSPLTRFDRQGGWDPGQLRAVPRLDWAAVVAAAGRAAAPLA